VVALASIKCCWVAKCLEKLFYEIKLTVILNLKFEVCLFVVNHISLSAKRSKATITNKVNICEKEKDFRKN